MFKNEANRFLTDVIHKEKVDKKSKIKTIDIQTIVFYTDYDFTVSKFKIDPRNKYCFRAQTNSHYYLIY